LCTAHFSRYGANGPFAVRFGAFAFTESVIIFKHVHSNGMRVLFDASCIALAKKGNLMFVTEDTGTKENSEQNIPNQIRFKKPKTSTSP